MTPSLRVSIHVSRKASAAPLATLLGDEQLAERHFESRTSPTNENWKYSCTPSVMRFYPEPREGSGDYRVNVSLMKSAYLVLNGERDMDDPKTRYLFSPITALFNSRGYPQQAYITMQGNKLKGAFEDEWFVFETLKPNSATTYKDENDVVRRMSFESHPHFIHRFDLVCWNKGEDGQMFTRHHPNTPQGIIQYFLVSNEGVGWIPSRYVKI